MAYRGRGGFDVVDVHVGAGVPAQRATAGATSSPQSSRLPATIDDVLQLARLIGRDDLVERLTQTAARLNDPNVRVIVVGEFKKGKSKLINALVSAPICPVDDDVATSVPTAVGFGEEPAAWVTLRRSENAPAERQAVALDEIARYVSESGNPGNELRVVSADVELPREILRGGLRLVDSPGVGGLDSTNALATLAALTTAHAVLLVSDASQGYTEPEVQFLRHAMRVSPNVAAVLSKTDLYPHWRAIEQIDHGYLDGLGEVPIFSVSSDLRLLAASAQDAELNDESGFPALVRHLRNDVLGRAELVHTRGAVHDLLSVMEQLRVTLSAELHALQHPEDTPALIAQLEEAKERADEFRSRSSRWQTTLNDGVSDLISDMEHDLRDRLRKVQRDSEAAIDDGDPGPIWEQFSEWLDQRVSTVVSETFVWTDERSRWLSEDVAELFIEGEGEIPVIDVGDTAGVLDTVEELGLLESGEMGAAEKIFIGVRGSYGGVLMTGLVTGLIGMSLVNPLSLLVGVLVGRRAYREDRNQRLSRRRFEAKNIVRRHIDDVQFQVGKQLKDRLRLVQRAARDHFGAIAEEIHRSLSEAVLAAKQSAGTFAGERDQRIKLLQNQLARLESLRTSLPSIAPVAAVERARR